jgi:Holliday junction resolvasome RuvABC endonuclease subunit
MILAIDAATKTGWALIKDGKVYESGVQDFSKRRGESNGAMFLKFRNWIGRMLDLPGITFVTYEQTFSRSQAATEILENLRGRVQKECAARNIEYAPVYATELKKWACGSGKADKGQMMARAVALLGRPPLDDNEADACLMGAWAFEEYGK